MSTATDKPATRNLGTNPRARDTAAQPDAAAAKPAEQPVVTASGMPKSPDSQLIPFEGGPQNKAEKFLEAAGKFKDQPYKWGGGHTEATMKQPGPVDCSGLVLQAARQAGINLDGTAADQQKQGKPVDMKDLKPGDLVFRGKPAHHVGIYMGNGQVLHAPKAGEPVQMSPVSFFESARRVFPEPARTAATANAPAADASMLSRARNPSLMSLPGT